MTVVLLDKSKSWTSAARAKLSTSVWTFGTAVGMAKLSTHSRSNGGYVFRRQGGEEYRSNACPNLTLADVGIREGDTVEFLGDFEPFVPAGAAATADAEARFEHAVG